LETGVHQPLEALLNLRADSNAIFPYSSTEPFLR
jgi:hypothetical protein